jgi:hypothetical protein
MVEQKLKKNARWSSKKMRGSRAKKCELAGQKLNKKIKMAEQKMRSDLKKKG